jgi:hypothetical protein
MSRAITLNEVKQLADQLPPEEQIALVEYLQQQTHRLTVDEKKALLDSLIVETGAWSADQSLRREDWYH